MRVTLNIDGDLADSFKEQALLLGKPFGQVVNDALRRGVSFIAVEATEPRYRVVPNQSVFSPQRGSDAAEPISTIS